MKYIKTVLSAALSAAVLAGGGAANAGTLDEVRARGAVRCGVNAGNVTGLSAMDSSGKWSGLDVDLCRAVAAAVFGDAAKTKYVPLTDKDRLSALQAGDVDVLTHNTTWTISRDSRSGLDFRAINYYDGQGFIVPKSLGIKSAQELSGATICLLAGTTNELNVADYFKAHGMEYTPLVFEKLTEIETAYGAGRCDSFTVDTTQLVALRMQLPNPDDHAILPELISKEPLGPVVRQNDSQWLDIVSWAHYAMVAAEEFGITSANVDEMTTSKNPDVRRFLGEEKDQTIGKDLGLDEKWAYTIVKQVGNYGESFDRNLGEGSPLKTERGLNALWTEGGLQYAPPIR